MGGFVTCVVTGGGGTGGFETFGFDVCAAVAVAVAVGAAVTSAVAVAVVDGAIAAVTVAEAGGVLCAVAVAVDVCAAVAVVRASEVDSLPVFADDCFERKSAVPPPIPSTTIPPMSKIGSALDFCGATGLAYSTAGPVPWKPGPVPWKPACEGIAATVAAG